MIVFRGLLSESVASLGYEEFMIKLISFRVGLEKSDGAKLLNFGFTWMILIALNDIWHCTFIMVWI